jgi:hypothetical protein
MFSMVSGDIFLRPCTGNLLIFVVTDYKVVTFIEKMQNSRFDLA